jgi:hypothetical protein
MKKAAQEHKFGVDITEEAAMQCSGQVYAVSPVVR